MRTSVTVESDLLGKVMQCQAGKSCENVLDEALGKHLERLHRNSPKDIDSGSQEAEKVRKRWIDWLEKIRDEVVDLFGAREIFQRFTEITNEEPDLLRMERGFFYDWIIMNYSQRAVITVRKLVDTCDDTVSLCRLIEDIKLYPTVITRECYVEPWINGAVGIRRDMRQKRANEAFDEFAGAGGLHPDPSILSARLEQVQLKSHKIRNFANTVVAHLSTSGTKQAKFSEANFSEAKFSDLNGAIDSVGELFTWVCELLTRKSIYPKPVIPDWSWQSLFVD